MRIQKDNPLLAAGNPSALKQMQSIAYVFSQRFGRDTMPAEFQEFAVRPVVPKPVPTAEPTSEGETEPKGEAASEEAKPKGEVPAAKAK